MSHSHIHQCIHHIHQFEPHGDELFREHSEEAATVENISPPFCWSAPNFFLLKLVFPILLEKIVCITHLFANNMPLTSELPQNAIFGCVFCMNCL